MENWRLMLDATLVVTIVGLAWRLRRLGPVHAAEVAPNVTERLEQRLAELEAGMGEWRSRAEAQLRILAKICDQARAILERGRIAPSRFASDEALELKSMLPRAGATGTPARPEWEEQRDRLGAEVATNLKTLLRDQLS